MSPQLETLLAVRLVTQDPAGLARFYAEALGAEIAERAPIPSAEAGWPGAGERWTLRLMAQRIELDAFAHPGAPYPRDIAADDARFQHMAVVTAGIEATFATAMSSGAGLISRAGPVKLPAASGGATAVKLRDPEGHPFELLALPAGAWDRVAANSQGVRGIDHSAIVVRDLNASRNFYASLGLTEREATFNHGPEQAALDGLDAPEVDVGPLFASGAPPHLELLHYRFASRLAASAAAVGDRDVAATCLLWRTSGASGPTLLRDPDGHRHLLDPIPPPSGDR